MGYLPATPFRRTGEICLAQRLMEDATPLPRETVNKWEVLRDLATARESYGLSDRDLTVLQALLSFHPAADLRGARADLIVFPSNRSICTRLNNMPCSTMRRHLARLVATGVILRRDSPNGKRYARHGNDAKNAYGFDLSPLVMRGGEFQAAALAVREDAAKARGLRETIQLLRRDLLALASELEAFLPDCAHAAICAETVQAAGKLLRRKPDLAALLDLEATLREQLRSVQSLLRSEITTNPNSNDTQNEQHHHNSKTEIFESDSDAEQTSSDKQLESHTSKTVDPGISLGSVLEHCRELQSFGQEPIKTWDELTRLAEVIAPMMGICRTGLIEAKRAMGSVRASIVIAAMLERFHEIRSPGGYLRHLSKKAALGQFHCGPMVRALGKGR